MSMRIGIDLGGTKISAIVLSDTGHELYRQRIATPAKQGAQAIVAAIAELVAQLKRECRIRRASIGIGTPGAVATLI